MLQFQHKSRLYLDVINLNFSASKSKSTFYDLYWFEDFSSLVEYAWKCY